MPQKPIKITQNPFSERPQSVYPESRKEMLGESVRQARQDIQNILTDTEENRRPWPKVPENAKRMGLSNLVERIKVLNEEEDRLLWEIEMAEKEEDSKKVVDLRGKKLDLVRLRRTFGELIQTHKDAAEHAEDMFLKENSPVESKDKPGYVYMGRYKDQEVWIKDQRKPMAKAA